jgi:hypothetical protein
MIRSLNVEETGHRLEEVQAQFTSTFEWIISNKELEYKAWLQDRRGLYWISGKPGSGKSTLMKFIRQHPRTLKYFSEAEPSAEHILIDFFFHDRGSPIQKSLEGLLYRSLHLILKAPLDERNREILVGMILPSFASRPLQKRTTWTTQQLRQAFEAILAQDKFELRLLLFFDALDEFDGEAQTIAGFISDLARPRAGSATLIKVCCSSRPWNVFRDSFGDMPGCKVHEHTKDDIQNYIRGRFESNQQMLGMIKSRQGDTRDTAQRLEDTLSDRAQGVFIWVRLVLDELLKACTDGAVPEELIQSLSTFPDDLDDSYRRLINRIPIEYRFETYAFVETVLRSNDALGLRDLGLVVLCASAKSPSEAVGRLPSDPYSVEFLISTTRRLQSRCGGMLEVLPDTTVQFMHQTAKEYFSGPGSTEAIVRHNPDLWRENGYSFLAKFFFTFASSPATGPRGFDWQSYIFTMYRTNWYIRGPHHSGVISVPVSHLEGRLGCDILRYYGFDPSKSVERCIWYAYLSEKSTGRSQWEFLSKITDTTIQAFPTDPTTPKRGLRSMSDLAQYARLQLFLADAWSGGRRNKLHTSESLPRSRERTDQESRRFLAPPRAPRHKSLSPNPPTYRHHRQSRSDAGDDLSESRYYSSRTRSPSRSPRPSPRHFQDREDKGKRTGYSSADKARDRQANPEGPQRRARSQQQRPHVEQDERGYTSSVPRQEGNAQWNPYRRYDGEQTHYYQQLHQRTRPEWEMPLRPVPQRQEGYVEEERDFYPSPRERRRW